MVNHPNGLLAPGYFPEEEEKEIRFIVNWEEEVCFLYVFFMFHGRISSGNHFSPSIQLLCRNMGNL